MSRYRNVMTERPHVGRYRVEKLVHEGLPTERWALMSSGDADRGARPGHELDLLIRQAKVFEGTVRILQGETVVWPPELCQ